MLRLGALCDVVVVAGLRDGVDPSTWGARARRPFAGGDDCVLMKFADKDSRICASVSTTTPYELRGEEGNDTRGKEDDVGVSVQEEHDGLEEDRSDPEGRGARGPARPT